MVRKQCNSKKISHLLGSWKQTIINVLKVGNQDYALKLQQIVTKSHGYRQALLEVDYEKLSFEDIEVLSKLGLKHLILSPAVKTIDDMLERGDLEEISSRVSNAHQTIFSANELFSDFLNSFDGIFGPIVDIEEVDNHGKVLTRVRFHNDASISNVVNLSEWTAKWNTIARGYSMVLNKPPEEFEVVSASKGSIIFDLLVNLETVNMIGETFNHLADFALTCAELRLLYKGAEIVSGDPGLKQKIEEYAKEKLEGEKEKMSEDIADKLIEKFSGDGTNGEVKSNLKKSIREIENFVNKGGDIDFRAEGNEPDKAEQIEYVKDALKQLQDRSSQKQLEDKSREKK